MPVIYREAAVDDAEAMGRADGDQAGSAAAPLMARWVAGEHHPQPALPPRTTFFAEASALFLAHRLDYADRQETFDAELDSLALR